MTDIVIRLTDENDASQVSVCVDSVARERLFLADTKGFSVEETLEFIRFVRNAGGAHLVAVNRDSVVGWCDITPYSFEGLTHCGRLGMGLLSEYRGRGIGKKLLAEALPLAFRNGLERIELEVFASNIVAVRLYRYFGFLEEGRKRKARKLDGTYDDVILFGLLDEEWLR
ncbi:GNAT family N-acetyltransferase [Prosthecochloris sp.]|uniref:GNAT family N-acetyltransferase n=1 Tax=Prosthecochloris sp. TaxID=290513 RepID=UPI0025F65788|nr:GNAT family N-acetyltransferase [Prosthecochloris sp.]